MCAVEVKATHLENKPKKPPKKTKTISLILRWKQGSENCLCLHTHIRAPLTVHAMVFNILLRLRHMQGSGDSQPQ